MLSVPKRSFDVISGSRLNKCLIWSSETGDGVSCFNINIARNEQSIDYAGFPVRMKQALLRELEWLGSFSAVRHWVHDVLSSILVLSL